MKWMGATAAIAITAEAVAIPLLIWSPIGQEIISWLEDRHQKALTRRTQFEYYNPRLPE
jgi:hypothetical protein